MDSSYIIKRPLLTEKSTFASSEQRRYSFLVDGRATKTEIKKAIQDLYKVRVVGINTNNRTKGERRLKYGVVPGKTSKRAIVRIHDEDTIELF